MLKLKGASIDCDLLDNRHVLVTMVCYKEDGTKVTCAIYLDPGNAKLFATRLHGKVFDR